MPSGRARVYDRLAGGEGLEGPKRRFAEVDASAEALRPGAVVALATQCDELLAAHRTDGNWSLNTISTEWSSRGETGWHTHAGDYAVESMEPECLFRVVREGPRIIFASVAADGRLLCACSSGSSGGSGGDSLGLVACSNGSAVAAGAAWEQQDGAWCNSKWPNKVMPMGILHVTCLPTSQLQRVEEFYGGLLHELHAEKSVARKRVQELEAERDAAMGDALQWRQQREQQQVQQQPGGRSSAAGGVVDLQPEVTLQLAALQQQLEHLATDTQERARMSIAIRTIKDITDLVRQSASPSCTNSPNPTDAPLGLSHASTDGHPAPIPPPAFAEDSEGESRLVDYLGSRPEEGDPLARVLDQPPLDLSDSPHKRALLRRSRGGSVSSLDSPPSGGGLRTVPALLSKSVSLAVTGLSAGSPRQADGMAQYIATGPMPLRASQQGLPVKPANNPRASKENVLNQRSSRTRSSFLQRAPAAAADLFSL